MKISIKELRVYIKNTIEEQRNDHEVKQVKITIKELRNHIHKILCESTEPEYESVESFVQYKMDDEEDSFDTEELQRLNFTLRMPVKQIRIELEKYGLRFVPRAPQKNVRGVNTSSNDRWYGPGSMKTHGGSGINPQSGVAD